MQAALRSLAHRRRSAAMAQPSKTLVAFDFDHTVVDANSDTWIYRTLESKQLPSEIKAKYQHGQWTKFMNDVLEFLADQGVWEQQLKEALQGIPLTPGFKVRGHPPTPCHLWSDATKLSAAFLSPFEATLCPPPI
jgi:hypothetical protein